MNCTARVLTGVAAAGCLTLAGTARQGEPVNGMRPVDLRIHAITDATVVVAPGEIIESATILIDDGVITDVGAEVEIPAGARVWPATGLTVYPGLIDAAILTEAGDLGPSPGRHWNERVRPERVMRDVGPLSAATRKQLREAGITVAAVYPKKGIFRGTGVVTTLDAEEDHLLVLSDRAAQFTSIEERGGWGSGYPGSMMGTIALIRQTLLDADWHARARTVFDRYPEGNEAPAPNEALAALEDVLTGRQPILVEVSDELNALRAGRIAREFDLDLMLIGSGTEFRRLDEILEVDASIILPLKFPERPDVTTMAKADATSLRDLQTWEQAPTNPRRLVNAGATVAFTTHRLKSPKDLFGALRTAVKHGLTEEQALAGVTTTPAMLLGIDHIVGTIEPGKAANLVVVDGSLFDKKAKVRDTWINGRRHRITDKPAETIAFSGHLQVDGGPRMPIAIDTKKSEVKFPLEEKAAKAKKVNVDHDRISMLVDGRPFEVDGYVQLRGVLNGPSMTGTGVMPDGRRFTFTVAADPDAPEAEEEPKTDETPEAVAATDDDAKVVERPARSATGPEGEWSITIELAEMGRSFDSTIVVEAQDEGYEASMSMMGREMPFDEVSFDPATGKLTMTGAGPGGNAVTMEAVIEGDAIRGESRRGDFSMTFTGSRMAVATAVETDEAEESKAEEFVMPAEQIALPLGAYGAMTPPAAEDVLIENATIWTSADAGILEEASILIRDGKIEAIGRGTLAAPPGIRRIDAAGRHVTPGLFDCHSHTGISGGVNEGGQANTAEVRIGDVITPDDINWYRQLAGGLTVANQLHGSANPIGGQNSVVKLKWGGALADLPIDDAIPGIKFALGENVKRSQSRYPNTRMGVETFIRDAFTAAVAYRDEQRRYDELPLRQRKRRMPPRRDLELDTLVEILEGDRLVHCHSYRQDEILMLIRVAEEFGFTIGTFQHVLEGYKVAEAIAQHGAGASSFSDWWAYKVEVMDAIPHNGALMTNVGVLVSFNSDSSEVARRMNTEASKAVRYGQLSPQEALKLVTINPARQLRVDHRTGSLEVGKDADFVIWSGDPLSTYTKCEQTWIEGACYFDLETDAAARRSIRDERQRLIQKALAGNHGAPPAFAEPAEGTPAVSAAWREWAEEQVRLGLDPELLAPGDCGCSHLDLHGHGGE